MLSQALLVGSGLIGLASTQTYTIPDRYIMVRGSNSEGLTPTGSGFGASTVSAGTTLAVSFNAGPSTLAFAETLAGSEVGSTTLSGSCTWDPSAAPGNVVGISAVPTDPSSYTTFTRTGYTATCTTTILAAAASVTGISQTVTGSDLFMPATYNNQQKAFMTVAIASPASSSAVAKSAASPSPSSYMGWGWSVGLVSSALAILGAVVIL